MTSKSHRKISRFDRVQAVLGEKLSRRVEIVGDLEYLLNWTLRNGVIFEITHDS